MIKNILDAIDAEISRLQEASRVLGGSEPNGRVHVAGKKRKRILSSEARARIAAAQKKRWAKSKKSAK